VQRRGFGVAGALPAKMIRQIALAVEDAGYRTFWVNDTPDGDGLAALREAADVTRDIHLAVGVIPLDRTSAEVIGRRVTEMKLPVDRLTVGVGSGSASGGLARVQHGVESLREVTLARVLVGALGPKMCALAGATADGALLNWLTPHAAVGSTRAVRDAAEQADRPRPFIAGYVRTALGVAARNRLVDEAGRYASFPAYSANFSRMGVAAIDTAIGTDRPEEIGRTLAAFSAFDEVVVRAVTGGDSLDDYLKLIEAAAPARVDPR